MCSLTVINSKQLYNSMPHVKGLKLHWLLNYNSAKYTTRSLQPRWINRYDANYWDFTWNTVMDTEVHTGQQCKGSFAQNVLYALLP